MASSTRCFASLLILVFTAPAFASGSEPVPRAIAPTTVVMQLPASMGAMERPAVEFNHAAHTTALEAEGCRACHTIDDRGLQPTLTATTKIEDLDELVDAFHDTCMGCHKERIATSAPTGPITCGECHVKHEPGESQRLAMAFDYSLHGRHSLAYEDKCETCHHVYDEVAQKLIYAKGKEEACTACHGAVDEEQKPSLRNAAHRSCVSCHLKRIERQLDSGPMLCAGCHDPQYRAAIRQIEDIPRLVRGQPDTAWVTSPDARSKSVGFNHLAHEPLTTSCSTCHHQTLKACSECHTLAGSEEGAGITMESSFHLRSSEHSCVGCHRLSTDQQDCAGCHNHLVQQPPGPRACAVCHAGPEPALIGPDTLPPVASQIELATLPATSDAFPETVAIDSLVEQYELSNLPHAKIVAKLDSIVRSSSLAGRFHETTETLCAGCHHRSPVGTRPPPCRACHGGEADTTRDKPELKVAYHRQCIGCHIDMGIAKRGCTDCHASKEVQE